MKKKRISLQNVKSPLVAQKQQKEKNISSNPLTRCCRPFHLLWIARISTRERLVRVLKGHLMSEGTGTGTVQRDATDRIHRYVTDQKGCAYLSN